MNPDEQMEKEWLVAMEFCEADELIAFKSFDVEKGEMEYSIGYSHALGFEQERYSVTITIAYDKKNKWGTYCNSSELIKLGGKISVDKW